MNIFEILGPVMVGPSSSHTAGAVRIGLVTRRLLGEEPVRARIGMCGSFLATGKGHGTDRALVAGLLGMHPDDERIPDSLRLAREAGLAVDFEAANIQDAHPNTALSSLVESVRIWLKIRIHRDTVVVHGDSDDIGTLMKKTGEPEFEADWDG